MERSKKGGKLNYDVYLYKDSLGEPLWLSDSDNFREAYRHCELYFKKQPKAAILMHDNVLDDWWIYQPDRFILAVDSNYGV